MNPPTARRASRTRAVRSALAAVAAASLSVAGLIAAPAPALADTVAQVPPMPATVTADPLPTVQINGVAWSQVVVGNYVYVAGKYSSARPAGAPPGVQENVRGSLLAYDIRTGVLRPDFAPILNAQALVVAASPDGSRIYVGGDFTRANGQVRNHVAAYDTATGALVPGFAPAVTGQVRAMAVSASTLYLGGSITAVGSVSRSRLAAVSASTGALLPWAPVPGVGSTAGNHAPLFDSNGQIIPGSFDTVKNAETSTEVMSLVLTGGGSEVVAAGRFDSLNGVKSTGVGALDAGNGSRTLPFAINQLITNQGINSAVYSLTTDGVNVYGTGYDFGGPGNLEGSFAADAVTGRTKWIADCRGDTYSSFPSNGVLYLASHSHSCANIGSFPQQDPISYRYAGAMSIAATGTNHQYDDLRANTNFVGQPAPSQAEWYPQMAPGTFTGQYEAGWTVTGNGTYVVYGGEFPRVNGVDQVGLVRFAVAGVAPGRVAPSAGGLTPTVTSLDPGTARVSWVESADNDDQVLTYRVYRDNGTVPVHEVSAPSTWWNTQQLSFTDTGLAPGTHTYRVAVVDPLGVKNTGAWVPVTVLAGTPAPPRAYADLVRADGAADYWPLGESGGTVARDRAGGADLTIGSGVRLGRPGAVTGDKDTAAAFDGTSASATSTTTPYLGLSTFSLEGWFQTTSKVGGKIVGWGTAQTGLSINYDRHVYMDGNGVVYFGVWAGSGAGIVQSAAGFNDGRWHHVVATLGADGERLYLDGKPVASRTDITTAEPKVGYWRIGGDQTWTGAPWFTGQIDEVAVYRSVLTPAQVAAHRAAGLSGTVANLPPSAVMTTSVSGLTVTADGSGSTDPDGTVSSYLWTFGDGATATVARTTHTYALTGVYPVTLTVTDDKGATSSSTTSVAVTAPPPDVPPTASFTAAASGLTAVLDGSTSSDPDGRVVSWAWDFGDGSRGTGAAATHTYAAAGTHTITLTVTDDRNATATAVRSVLVDPNALAADAFGRTFSGGLGTADVGGVWTASAGATRQSVTPGVAQLSLDAAGQNTGSYLGSVSQTSADVATSFTLSSAPTGSGTYVYLSGRRVAGQGEYRVRVRVTAAGQVYLVLSRLTGTTEAFPGGEVLVPGLTWTPGMVLQADVVVRGTGTTTVTASVWASGTARPATAALSRTDTTAALQAAGAVGISVYRTTDSTAATAVRFTGYTVTAAG